MQIIVAPLDRYTYSATEWRGHLAHGEPAMGIACRTDNILSPIGATLGGLYSAGFIRRWTELVARGERIQPLIGDVVAQALLPVFTADAFLTLDTGKSACATPPATHDMPCTRLSKRLFPHRVVRRDQVAEVSAFLTAGSSWQES